MAEDKREKYKSAIRFPSHILEGEGEFLVTSPFGERVHPVTGRKKFHSGVDGALWTGDDLVEAYICAWDAGIVDEASDDPLCDMGVHVFLRHEEGIATKYFHMLEGSLLVGKGERVEKGQRLGYMGSTGVSTGEHLHFQMEKDGIAVDPLPFLAQESR